MENGRAQPTKEETIALQATNDFFFLGLPRPAGGSLPSGLAGLLGPAAACGGFGLPLRGTRRAAQPTALRAFLLPANPLKFTAEEENQKKKRPLSGHNKAFRPQFDDRRE